MDRDVTSWIDALNSPDTLARRAAARHLAQSTELPDDAYLAFVRALDGERDDELFQWISAALENASAPEPKCVTELTEITGRFLNHQATEDAAFWAVTLLGRIGSEAAPAVSILSELLERADSPAIQFKSAWALGKIGPSACAAICRLDGAAENATDPRLATFARKAIEEIRR